MVFQHFECVALFKSNHACLMNRRYDIVQFGVSLQISDLETKRPCTSAMKYAEREFAFGHDCKVCTIVSAIASAFASP
jgi:hypothetical protein